MSYKVVLFWRDSAGFRNELRTDTEGRAALWSEEVEDREIWATNDSFAQAVADGLAAEVERLREALEGTIDPDTGHYWECIAGQRGHGQCSQLCERLRRALEEPGLSKAELADADWAGKP